MLKGRSYEVYFLYAVFNQSFLFLHTTINRTFFLNVKFLFSRIHEYLLSFKSKPSVCMCILLTRKRVSLSTSLNLLLPLLKFEMFRLLLPRGYLLLSLNLHLQPFSFLPNTSHCVVSAPGARCWRTNGRASHHITDGRGNYLLTSKPIFISCFLNLKRRRKKKRLYEKLPNIIIIYWTIHPDR